MAQEVARVARRLEEAKETKYLDLSKCELSQVPDATYLMLKNTNVEKCNLSGNCLKKIQPKFCTKLPSLTEINLEGNELTVLPDDFKNFEELTVIDISCNKFERLPSFIYECPKIQVVIAKDNKITDVEVDSLRKMPSLRELDLQDNPLSAELQEELSKLDRLAVHIGTSDPLGKQLDEVE